MKSKIKKMPFKSTERVCCHLYESIMKKEKIEPKPYIIGLFSDSYFLTWYCSKCIENFSLPKEGVFLFDFPEDESDYDNLVWFKKLDDLSNFELFVSKLDGYGTSNNIDNNPFECFSLDEESNHKYVDRSSFYNYSGLNEEKMKSIVDNTIMVPFGTKAV